MSNIVKASFVVNVPAKPRSDTREFKSSVNAPSKVIDMPVDLAASANGAEGGVPSGADDLGPDGESGDAIVERAMEKAAEIEEAARAKAREIVSEAEEKGAGIFEETRREGFEKGFAKGLSEGKVQALEEAKEGLNEIGYMIETLNIERMRNYMDEEEDLAAMSFEIAKKIMRQQIKVERDAIPLMIEDIVRENEDAVRVYLSEYNQTLFTRIDHKTREKLKELLPNIKLIMLPNDGSDEIIQVETENGMVDAAVGEQLQRLEDAVMENK